MKYQDILKYIQENFSQHRYLHVLGVAQTSKYLAKIHQEDQEKAYLAGLLHDIAKYQTPENLKKQNIIYHKKYQKIYEEFPKIWHAFIGPNMVKFLFNVTDTKILSAIKWHTTGRARMSTLEKILFIADYIEPNRDFKDQNYISNLAKNNLDQAVYALCISNIKSLEIRNLKIYQSLIQAKNYYQDKIGLLISQDIQEKIQEKIIKNNA